MSRIPRSIADIGENGTVYRGRFFMNVHERVAVSRIPGCQKREPFKLQSWDF